MPVFLGAALLTELEPYLLLIALLGIFVFLTLMIKLEQRRRDRRLDADKPRWDRIAAEEDELRSLRRRKLELQIALLEARLARVRRTNP